ncbi:MAG: ribosome maturation factor RimP [Alphaproteobacteria bacterium]|nr:ribosome maturation factor RimP [Alphaproteobacteria bacterium]
MTAALESGIERLLTPALEAMGFLVVRVKLTGQPDKTLQIMVEHEDGSTVTVGACSRISRAVSALLDVEDTVKGAYGLEISSPGIDRPLVKAVDFERFAGHVAKIETRRPRDGRKRFRGRLLGLDGDDVRIDVEGGEVAVIPLVEIVAAKLVLTDALIEAAMKAGRA